MKFNKQSVTEIIRQPKSGKKVFTEGKKQNVILSEEQLDRLLLQLKESREKSISSTIKDAYELIREAIKSEKLDLSVDDYSPVLTEDQSEWRGGRNPGVSAAEGLENIISGIKKAYDMIKDSDTRKKLANSMTKLGNFMTITADAMAAGRDQRSMRNADSLRDELPYPELETVTVDDELEEGKKRRGKSGPGTYGNDDVFPGPKEGGISRFLKSKPEGKKPDFLDLDGDGDTEESMKKASTEVTDDTEDIKEHKEKLIREEIKKMKQIIKPITKI